MTIELVNVSKSYRTLHGSHAVYRDFNLTIEPRQSIGIIGRNGAGKSTLLKLISGAERPDSGKVLRRMSVSWPLAFTGFFQPNLTGSANVIFAARLYGRDPRAVLESVRDFSGLGKFMDWPVKGYSTGMRGKLGFALSLAIKFDCLLIDEVLSVGDAAFREKAEAALETLRETSSIVMVTHNLKEIIRLCDRVIVIGGPEPIMSTDVKKTVKRFYYDMTAKDDLPTEWEGLDV
jgi:capsular polysaccharide transport system ATP-binding protein